jgi:hypothetical protein
MGKLLGKIKTLRNKTPIPGDLMYAKTPKERRAEQPLPSSSGKQNYGIS